MACALQVQRVDQVPWGVSAPKRLSCGLTGPTVLTTIESLAALDGSSQATLGAVGVGCGMQIMPGQLGLRHLLRGCSPASTRSSSSLPIAFVARTRVMPGVMVNTGRWKQVKSAG